jgi:Ca2+-binding RTX toxin-like protein
LAGADTLIGGPGDDTLEGGEGADTYYFSANSGHDRISDLERRSNVVDRVIFTDLTTTSLTRVARMGQSLRLHFGSSSSLTLVNQLEPLSRIEKFVFANGPAWGHDTLMRQLR